jgi:hypothetical protein
VKTLLRIMAPSLDQELMEKHHATRATEQPGSRVMIAEVREKGKPLTQALTRGAFVGLGDYPQLG